jgi:hypothetical protein
MDRVDINFRWFEGKKAQLRFVPYDWAFLFFTGIFKAGENQTF